MLSKPRRLQSVGDESMNMEYWCNSTDSGISKCLIKSAVHVTYQFLSVETFFFLRKRINTNLSCTVNWPCYTGPIRTKTIRSATKFHRYLLSKFDDEARGKTPPNCVFICVLRALNLQYVSNLSRKGAIKHRRADIEFVQRIQENNKSQEQKAT